ncbi:hypothetical protein FB107DRAFT_247890 [Schizophyllum commune]
MSEVISSFVYRAATEGLGGVYVEAAFASASGLIAIGAKTVWKRREAGREVAQEPAGVSVSPIDAPSANATVQRDDGDHTVPHSALVNAGDSTRRLTIQPPLPTLELSLPYANFNDTELDTNIPYAQNSTTNSNAPGANTDLYHNITIAAEIVSSNDSSITASSNHSTDAWSLSYATDLPPHITIIAICLIAPFLYLLAAVIVRPILRRLSLAFAHRPTPMTSDAAQLHPAALLVEAHTVPLPPSPSPSMRSVSDTTVHAATAANEEGDAHEDEGVFHDDSDEDIDDDAGAQGVNSDAPVGDGDAPIEGDVDVDVHVEDADALKESVDGHGEDNDARGKETGAQDVTFEARMDGVTKAEAEADEAAAMPMTGDELDAPVAAAENVEVGKERVPQAGTPRLPTNIRPHSKPLNEVDADDDATEPSLPVLARIKAWEQGRQAAAHGGGVQADVDTVKRGGGLPASPVLMDDVDDEEELPPAPVVERIKAWEQARTVVRRASSRKSAGRADDGLQGAEIVEGGEDQRAAPALTDDAVRSPALDDYTDVDEQPQTPDIETGMRSVASLKRLYEPFRFRLADSAPAAMNRRVKNDILSAVFHDYAAGGIIPDEFPGLSALKAHDDNARNRSCAIARGQEIVRETVPKVIYADGIYIDGPLATFHASMVEPILRRAPADSRVPTKAPGLDACKSDLLHLLLGLAYIENRETAPQIAKAIFEPAVNTAMNIYDARVKSPDETEVESDEALQHDALVDALFRSYFAGRQQPLGEPIAPIHRELWNLCAPPSTTDNEPTPSDTDEQTLDAAAIVAAASATVAAASATVTDASDAVDSSGNAEALVAALSDDELDASDNRDASAHLAAPSEVSGASDDLSATSPALKRKQDDDGEEEEVEESVRMKRARESTQE